MNKKLLTTLGCSGSIVLSLLGTNSVSAKEYVFTAPELDSQIAEIPESETDYPFVGCGCSAYDAETAAEIDREGDKAIELYGCDCAGHRNMVRNLDSNKINDSYNNLKLWEKWERLDLEGFCKKPQLQMLRGISTTLMSKKTNTSLSADILSVLGIEPGWMLNPARWSGKSFSVLVSAIQGSCINPKIINGLDKNLQSFVQKGLHHYNLD